MRGLVYFIKCKEGAPRVKIGFTSKSVYERLKSLQTGSADALEVYAVLYGDKDREKSLHRKFAKYRLHTTFSSEWFHLSPAIAEWVAAEPQVERELWGVEPTARKPSAGVMNDAAIRAENRKEAAARRTSTERDEAALYAANLQEVLNDDMDEYRDRPFGAAVLTIYRANGCYEHAPCVNDMTPELPPAMDDDNEDECRCSLEHREGSVLVHLLYSVVGYDFEDDVVDAFVDLDAAVLYLTFTDDGSRFRYCTPVSNLIFELDQFEQFDVVFRRQDDPPSVYWSVDRRVFCKTVFEAASPPSEESPCP